MAKKTKKTKKSKKSKNENKNKKKKKKADKKAARDRHYLYTAAVQSVEADLDFFKRIYKKRNGKTFRFLREDFCGTAVLAHEFVRRNRRHHAWGVDLDEATLDWGREHYGPRLGSDVERLQLRCANVLDVREPRVDIIAALNFSYSVFHTREELGRYFAQVRRSLRPGGILFLDSWGGFDVMCEDIEPRRIDAGKAFDGVRIPAFKYLWEQARFNPVDHRILCYIHFKMYDGTRMRKAFTYDWRLWTLPEIQELMLEAGFRSTQVYVEGWDDEADDSDGIFRRKTYFENQAGWVAYVVGLT